MCALKFGQITPINATHHPPIVTYKEMQPGIGIIHANPGCISNGLLEVPDKVSGEGERLGLCPDALHRRF
jgi:hypothetical protein